MKSNYSQCLTNCRAVILQILNEQMNIYCLRLWKEPVVRGEREWNVRCFFSTHYTPELSSEEWFIIWNLWWCGGVLFSWYTSYFIVVTLKHSKIWDWMLMSQTSLTLPQNSEPSWMIHGILIPPELYCWKLYWICIESKPVHQSCLETSQEITFRSSRSLHLTLKRDQTWNYTVQPKFSFTSHHFWENSL